MALVWILVATKPQEHHLATPNRSEFVFLRSNDIF